MVNCTNITDRSKDEKIYMTTLFAVSIVTEKIRYLEIDIFYF